MSNHEVQLNNGRRFNYRSRSTPIVCIMCTNDSVEVYGPEDYLEQRLIMIKNMCLDDSITMALNLPEGANISLPFCVSCEIKCDSVWGQYSEIKAQIQGRIQAPGNFDDRDASNEVNAAEVPEPLERQLERMEEEETNHEEERHHFEHDHEMIENQPSGSLVVRVTTQSHRGEVVKPEPPTTVSDDDEFVSGEEDVSENNSDANSNSESSSIDIEYNIYSFKLETQAEEMPGPNHPESGPDHSTGGPGQQEAHSRKVEIVNKKKKIRTAPARCSARLLALKISGRKNEEVATKPVAGPSPKHQNTKPKRDKKPTPGSSEKKKRNNRKCTQCGRVLKTPGGLSVHTQRIHKSKGKDETAFIAEQVRENSMEE